MHEKYIELISQAIDQELSHKENEELQAHLARCEECRQYYALLTTLDDTIAAHQEEPPAALHGAIMNSIRSESKKTSPVSWFKRYRFTAVAAAAALIIMAAAYIGPFSGEIISPAADTPDADIVSAEEVQGGGTAALMRAMPAPAEATVENSPQWIMPGTTAFTDDRISAMESAGHSGNAAILTGISPDELSGKYPSRILDTGETVYELTFEELSRLTEETGAKIIETYTFNDSDEDAPYWVFPA